MKGPLIERRLWLAWAATAALAVGMTAGLAWLPMGTEVKLLAGGCGLVALGVLGAWLIRRALRPLASVTTVMEALRDGDFALRLKRRRGGVLAELQGHLDLPHQGAVVAPAVVGEPGEAVADGDAFGEDGLAAALGDQLHRGHVDLVDIRPLFAVDFDGDEVLVQQRRHVFVVEALLFHHVAPMAGGITDGEKYRLVLRLRCGKRSVPPAIPVHRVVRVLQQVGGVFENQPVGITRRPVLVPVLRAQLVGTAFLLQRLLQT